MQSGSGAHVKPKFNGKPGISLKTPLSSHYYDLRQFQPEEDLIELNEEPPTPQIQTEHSNLPLHRSCGSPSESNHGLKRYQAKSSTRVQEQMTLLDLEDPLIQGDSASRDGRIAGGERSRIGRQSYNLICWEKQASHKMQRKAPGSIPHERTDCRTAEKIKAILEVRATSAEQDILHKNDEDTTWFSVVREDDELPTFRDSGDVHLYSDPQTCMSDNLIMYADCEGLESGERGPLGARLKRKNQSSKAGRVDSFERKLQKIHHTSERAITWADTNAKRSRDFTVTHLYPRLLHTFSDVVVFVLKNPRYIRINPQLKENPPGLDDVESLPYIQGVVREMSSTDDSKEISELGKFMRNKLQCGYELYFVIQEEHRGQHAKKVSVSTDVIERMIRKRLFKMDNEMYPISRFPRSLLQDEDSKPRTRQNVTLNSNRWAGRTPIQRIHHKSWIPPDLAEQRSDSDKISHYSKQDYVIGESSQGLLQRIAHRLNNGPSPAQMMPEPDTSDLESEMAELSRQRSAAIGLDANSFAVELDAGPAVYLTQQANRPQGETDSSRLLEGNPMGHPSGPSNEPQDLQADTEHASPRAAPQVGKADRKWEGGFFRF
ncbi:hypothetical protein HO133_002125 [Letharia lupina]|uniref:Uncharacterized protein n=1 Tax=Letharia lupina TaxID=560253 RepID=A0A8H6FAI4_9LECA|nr:uncharacterized protein HO133_002125 [Letharia lupina]KAF6221270.1 hypothetical protein HO133_002125 [Letharia lupina]